VEKLVFSAKKILSPFHEIALSYRSLLVLLCFLGYTFLKKPYDLNDSLLTR